MSQHNDRQKKKSQIVGIILFGEKAGFWMDVPTMNVFASSALVKINPKNKVSQLDSNFS